MTFKAGDRVVTPEVPVERDSPTLEGVIKAIGPEPHHANTKVHIEVDGQMYERRIKDIQSKKS